MLINRVHVKVWLILVCFTSLLIYFAQPETRKGEILIYDQEGDNQFHNQFRLPSISLKMKKLKKSHIEWNPKVAVITSFIPNAKIILQDFVGTFFVAYAQVIYRTLLVNCLSNFVKTEEILVTKSRRRKGQRKFVLKGLKIWSNIAGTLKKHELMNTWCKHLCGLSIWNESITD